MCPQVAPDCVPVDAAVESLALGVDSGELAEGREEVEDVVAYRKDGVCVACTEGLVDSVAGVVLGLVLAKIKREYDDGGCLLFGHIVLFERSFLLQERQSLPAVFQQLFRVLLCFG